MRALLPAQAFLLLLLAACGSPGKPGEPPRDPSQPPPGMHVQKPWTLRFLVPGLLVADEVRIEGPDDLLEHVAVRQDPTISTTRQETTRDGLLLTTEVLPGVDGARVEAQLDALEIVALKRLVVLQRPGEVPVRLRAAGDVYSKCGDQEEHVPTLEIVGQREK